MSWLRPTRRCAVSSGWFAGRVDQTEADTAHGAQVAGGGRGLAELAAQPGDMDVDGAVAAAVRLLPDLHEQLPARHHLALPGHQGEQQLELLAGELERLTSHG